MSYSVRFSNTVKNPIVVADSAVNHNTSLNLVGKNSSNYGQLFAENFLHLLENAANLTAPATPVEGQLWYDTSAPTSKILKVYDGANWVPANGVHQASSNPISKKVGDIWVDTLSSQLNIWNGYEWLLIGPTSSSGLKNGIYPTKILDNLGDQASYHSVILSYINDDVITIVAKESFTPNPLISGFSALVPGLNVSTKQFNGATARLGGLANTALSLQVSSSTDPVLADYFLRNDVPGRINGSLRIDGDTGLWIGNVTQTMQLYRSGGRNAVLANRLSGSNIGLSVLKGNTLNEILTVDGNYLRVGINNTAPTVELDVIGSAKISGTLEVGDTVLLTNTTEATALGVAGFVTESGASIAKKMIVGDDVTINGQLYLSWQDGSNNPIAGAAMMPARANTYDLGAIDTPFRKVYANEFVTTSTAFSMVPTGAISLFAGAVAPDGFLLCDGSSKLRVDYPKLFKVISTAYGAVNENQFNIPQLTAVPATNPNVSVSLNYIIKY
jgi:hypothetical protein